MLGQHIDSLNVYLNSTATGNATLVWSKRGNQGDAWISAQVTLTANESAEVIVFEGVRGNGYHV
jgi:hypothetical protein